MLIIPPGSASETAATEPTLITTTPGNLHPTNHPVVREALVDPTTIYPRQVWTSIPPHAHPSSLYHGPSVQQLKCHEQLWQQLDQRGVSRYHYLVLDWESAGTSHQNKAFYEWIAKEMTTWGYVHDWAAYQSKCQVLRQQFARTWDSNHVLGAISADTSTVRHSLTSLWSCQKTWWTWWPVLSRRVMRIPIMDEDMQPFQAITVMSQIWSNQSILLRHTDSLAICQSCADSEMDLGLNNEDLEHPAFHQCSPPHPAISLPKQSQCPRRHSPQWDRSWGWKVGGHHYGWVRKSQEMGGEWARSQSSLELNGSVGICGT